MTSGDRRKLSFPRPVRANRWFRSNFICFEKRVFPRSSHPVQPLWRAPARAPTRSEASEPYRARDEDRSGRKGRITRERPADFAAAKSARSDAPIRAGREDPRRLGRREADCGYANGVSVFRASRTLFVTSSSRTLVFTSSRRILSFTNKQNARRHSPRATRSPSRVTESVESGHTPWDGYR